MGLDIRLPIGLMFSILGFVLLAYSLIGNKEIYQRSLGININFWWGLVVIIFGLAMLGLGIRGAKDKANQKSDE
jgi:hypothetical protein